MICSSLYLLFLMSAILPMSGRHFLYLGTAGGLQVTSAAASALGAVYTGLSAAENDPGAPAGASLRLCGLARLALPSHRHDRRSLGMSWRENGLCRAD